MPLVQCGWPALVGWRFLCVCAFDGFLLWVRIASACPTIASLCNKTRATNGKPPTRPLYRHLTNTPHAHHTATLCHRGTRHRHRGAALTAGAAGTHAKQIQHKSRQWGNSPAPLMKPRHRSTGVLGRNRQNGRNLRCSKPRTLHTHTYIHIHLTKHGCPRQGGTLGGCTWGRGVEGRPDQSWRHQRDGEEGAQGLPQRDVMVRHAEAITPRQSATGWSLHACRNRYHLRIGQSSALHDTLWDVCAVCVPCRALDGEERGERRSQTLERIFTY